MFSTNVTIYHISPANLAGIDVIYLSILGEMDTSCVHCHALRSPTEEVKRERGVPVFGNCCNRGKVDIPDLQPVPEVFKQLWLGNNATAKHFRASSCT